MSILLCARRLLAFCHGIDFSALAGRLYMTRSHTHALALVFLIQGVLPIWAQPAPGELVKLRVDAAQTLREFPVVWN